MCTRESECLICSRRSFSLLGIESTVLRICAETLQPLPVGAQNYRLRVGAVIAAMGADLLGRILVDSEDVSLLLFASRFFSVFCFAACSDLSPSAESYVCVCAPQEGRWPGTMTLQLRFWGGGADSSRFYIRSTSFPAPSLAGVPPPAPAAGTTGASAPAQPSSSSAGGDDGNRSDGPLAEQQQAPGSYFPQDGQPPVGSDAIAVANELPVSTSGPAAASGAGVLLHLAEHRVR